MYSKLVVKNKSHYFNPDVSKAVLNIMHPNAYFVQKRQKEDYELRIFVETANTFRLGGKSYYYTFTYKNETLPYFYGVPCFDYLDLRELLNGEFYRLLRDSYNTRLKYFIVGERGEGKGIRGFENNSHYHGVFHLQPWDKSKPFTPLDADAFRSFIELYWMGKPIEVKSIYYKDSKLGICMPGKYNNGEITPDSFRWCGYLTKYITKYEGDERKHLVQAFRDILLNSLEQYSSHFKGVLGTVKEKLDNCVNPVKLLKSLLDDLLIDEYIYLKCLQELRLYKNRFGNKVRVSQHYGDYILDHDLIISNVVCTSLKSQVIEGRESIMIPYPSSKGIKYRSIGSYYYRKLLYDTEDIYLPRHTYVEKNGVFERKDTMVKNVRYVLSSLGYEYKSKLLEINIKKRMSKLEKVYNSFFYSTTLVNSFRRWASHNDIDVYLPLDMSSLWCHDILGKLRDIAVYDCVYSGRWFSEQRPLDYKKDFDWFLTPSSYITDFSPELESIDDYYTSLTPYEMHPDLVDIAGYSSTLAMFEDYLQYCADIKDYANYIEIRARQKLENDYQYSNRVNLQNL